MYPTTSYFDVAQSSALARLLILLTRSVVPIALVDVDRDSRIRIRKDFVGILLVNGMIKDIICS